MERIAELAVMTIFNLPLVILGAVLSCGKGAGMIAGYNTSSQAEKDRWNERALCRGTGVLVLAIAGCAELLLAGAVLGVTPLVWTGLALTFLVAIAGVIYINTSKRFRRK